MIKFHPFLALAVAATCAACGASFTASDAAGGTASVGQAGEANGGSKSSAGSSNAGDAGEPEAGGSGSAAGVVGSAGTGRGGSWGSGGGRWSGSGGSTAADCARLRQEYAAALEKARVCDKGSTDQCSVSSVLEPASCGCPVPVNAKSEATTTAKKAYQALQDSHCDYGGIVCDIVCAPIVSASCAQQAVVAGNGFACTAGLGIQN